MKLKGKVFFAMFFVVLLTLSLGTVTLISVTHRENLNREEEIGAEENRILRGSMAALLASVPKDSWKNPERVLREMLEEKLMVPEGMDQIRIWSSENLLYEKRVWQNVPGLDQWPEEGKMVQSLKEEENNWWICSVGTLQVDQTKLYVESWRNIQEVFLRRQKQCEVYRGMVLVATVITAAVSFAVASWLSEPIRKLSETSRAVAEGDLSARTTVVREDEIGSLAADINCMADALERDIRSLKETNERQERFIGNFAHELKTPLTSIIGYADLLRLKKTDSEFVREAAGYIFQEGKRLEQLSVRLLEIVLLKHGKIEAKEIQVEGFLDYLAQVLQPILKEKEIAFHWEVQPETVLMAEEILLETVMLNLADNARKACPLGGNIWMTVIQEENEICWMVEDDGRGVPQEELKHLTEAFYMEDKSRSRKEGGAGLGLAICVEILRLHGAALEMISAPGEGMKAVMRFPKGGKGQ